MATFPKLFFFCMVFFFENDACFSARDFASGRGALGFVSRCWCMLGARDSSKYVFSYKCSDALPGMDTTSSHFFKVAKDT